jgi:hypothetical protein
VRGCLRCIRASETDTTRAAWPTINTRWRGVCSIVHILLALEAASALENHRTVFHERPQAHSLLFTRGHFYRVNTGDISNEL